MLSQSLFFPGGAGKNAGDGHRPNMEPPDYSGTAWARLGRFSATNPTSFPEDPQPTNSQGPESRPGQPFPGTHRCREKVPDSVFQTVPGAGHCQGFIHSVIQIASRVDDTPRIVHA
ncbi:hypothetical protein CMEL01_02375 [Colletotrichum melonis]|uniref:Uncharacterized protein n=1 Tax=Colletotrichum melonis TaxID=1209925 RepID=A0AAI9ULL4_9PEZI|nr:hypothetical protein CMEL01_02375 [Colletotrichum melonis]